MDFSTMKAKLLNDQYESVLQFKSDFSQMCNNAMLYNDPNTIYYKEAQRLSKFGNDLIDLRIKEYEDQSKQEDEKKRQ